MPERDANQLAADVRAGIGIVSLDLSKETPALVALDELVALVGTLQQERDRHDADLSFVHDNTDEYFGKWRAAEAALAEANQRIAELEAHHDSC